jgi:HEAT repeat protein
VIGQAASYPAVESARKVCAGLHNAYRSIRLYPRDHPTVRSALDLLISTLTAHLDTQGPLVLQIEEDSLLYEDREVYRSDPNRDNLAFLMFRDGVRRLTIQPGVESRELEGLVDCLAHADQLADSDQDFTTALWEHDLVHIEYEVVDPFLEGDGVAGEAFDELRDAVFRRMSELTSVGAPGLEAPGHGGGGAGIGAGSGGDGTGTSAGSGGDKGRDAAEGGGESWTGDAEPVEAERVALTLAELERGEWFVANQTAPFDDFVVVLLEIVGDPSAPPDGEQAVARALEVVIARYLDSGNLDGIDVMMDRLSALEAQGRRPKGFGREILTRMATAEHLTHLIKALGSAPPAMVARIEEFLRGMHGSVYPALLEILATSADKGVRRSILGLLNMEGGVPADHLYPLMRDSRWYVVRNAVQLATGSGDPGLVHQLDRLIHYPDERVRREVIRSLDSLVDPRCLPLLVKALQDDDSSVRILAVRSLWRRGAKGQFPAIQARVESRDFETRPPEELEAFLVAFASLGGDKAVPALNKFWRRRRFGSRPTPLRVAAVQALGAVGSPEARQALEEAAKSGDAPLQRAATRALSEAQSASRDR